MGENSYTTVRVKKYIKDMLEKLGNQKSIASTITDLVEDNLVDVAVGIDNVIANNIDFSKLTTSERIKLCAFQVIYTYWKKITPDNYQTSFSLVDFLDIDNIITIDIYARIYTNTLKESTLRDDEKNNLNSLQYLRKFLFKGIDIEDYEKEINNVMRLFDPFEYSYPDKDYYADLIRAVMTKEKLQNLVKTPTTLKKVAELKKFIKEIVEHTNIGACAEEYEFSNINISNYKSFKNTILYSSLHAYDIDHLDSFDIYSISCMLHYLAKTSKNSMDPRAYSAILDIALTTFDEFNEFFDDSNYNSYLRGNLSSVGNNLEESMQFWIDYYSHVSPPLESNTRLEFLSRTPMHILERVVSEKNINILSRKKIKDKVAKYNELLSKPFVAAFYKNDCYWSSNKKEDTSFSSISKKEGKLQANFWSKVNTFDRVRLSYDETCTFTINTSEFMYIIKHILFLHQQKEEKFKHVHIDCWSEINIDTTAIQIHRNIKNMTDIENIFMFFEKTGGIILDSNVLDDLIKLSTEILNDKELNDSLVGTFKITG